MCSVNLFKRSLIFPNARLFVHEQLSCGRAAPEAIAHSACEFGILDQEALPDVLPSFASSPCPCMATARNIIAKYCEINSKRKNRFKIDQDKLWDALQEEAQAYDQGKTLTSEGEPNVKHECSKFAPALFDLLLQELIRYPE
jgi:hypothetical protein